MKVDEGGEVMDGKCNKHGVGYRVEEIKSSPGKTREFCPECEKERISPLMGSLLESQCPVCGYYCTGKGGFGCINKKSLLQGGHHEG